MFSLFNTNPKKFPWRAFWIKLAIILFVFVIILKLIQLQVFESNYLREKAKKMRQPSRNFVFRGEIVDRNGLRLASDTTTYDIYAHPRYYKTTPEEIAYRLSPILGKPKEVIFEKLNKLDVSTITLAKNVDREMMQKVRDLKIRGIDLARKSNRVYPQGMLASHILGYVNFDANLSAGVENTGAKDLEAVPKSPIPEYDGRGNVIYDFNTNPNFVAFPPKGNKLVLTIDSIIQHIAETELDKMIAKTNAERGTVIVMNPRNGEILAFAVLPSYNPSKYNKVNPYVVKNWVLSDVYPPGSTFKILTVASGLETGAISLSERLMDTGKTKIQGWDIENYDYRKKGAPGLINLKYLFAHSSNIGSLLVSLKIPVGKHYEMLRRFGIGSETGIDLPGESSGIIPKPAKWDRITHATIGFGYGIATTPIQMVSAVAAIANNGVWVTPHVIKYSPEEEKVKIQSRQVLSPLTAKEMTSLLSQSIEASGASAGKIPNYRVAGKTGTSRKPNPNGPGYLQGNVFTSFVGYFPASNPKILIMVVVDNPKGVEIWGSTVAGPVFNTIAEQTARILNIKPDAPGLHTGKQKS